MSTPKNTVSTPKNTVSTPKNTVSTPKNTVSTPKNTTSMPKNTISSPKSTQPSSEDVINTLPQGDLYLATMDDLPQIITIYNEASATKQATADLYPVSADDRKEWLQAYINNAKRPLYVLKNETGDIKAWGSFSNVKPRPAYHISAELSIYVSQDFQRQGIAKSLLSWMLAQAPKLGIQNVMAWVFSHNQPSLTLFERLGFESWGQLPKVCDMEGFLADVVIMGKHL